MSTKQRRDHKPMPPFTCLYCGSVAGECGHKQRCQECREVLVFVPRHATNRHETGKGSADGHFRHAK